LYLPSINLAEDPAVFLWCQVSIEHGALIKRLDITWLIVSQMSLEVVGHLEYVVLRYWCED